jgi:hypothetical protein
VSHSAVVNIAEDAKIRIALLQALDSGDQFGIGPTYSANKKKFDFRRHCQNRFESVQNKRVILSRFDSACNNKAFGWQWAMA